MVEAPSPMIEPLDRVGAVDGAVDETGLAWRSLAYELDCWANSDLTATLWWRDDDAVDVMPGLVRLRALAQKVSVPVALAVVPKQATQALAEFVADWPNVLILQHGYDHVNRAPDGAKKTELASGRPIGAMLTEIEQGSERLQALFGRRALPILVPPWNRISPALVSALPRLGLSGLSAFKGRKLGPPGIIEVNTHIDIMNWRCRSFIGERRALEAAIAHLRARRLGTEDQSEPTGLLTHHAVHDDDAWSFAERFLTVTRSHPAVRWIDAAAAFRLRS